MFLLTFEKGDPEAYICTVLEISLDSLTTIIRDTILGLWGLLRFLSLITTVFNEELQSIRKKDIFKIWNILESFWEILYLSCAPTLRLWPNNDNSCIYKYRKWEWVFKWINCWSACKTLLSLSSPRLTRGNYCPKTSAPKCDRLALISDEGRTI